MCEIVRKFALTLLLFCGSAMTLFSQTPTDGEIDVYLKRERLIDAFDAKLARRTELPKKIQEAAQMYFPALRFIDVEVLTGLRSIVSVPVDFLVVQDKSSGEFLGFIAPDLAIASPSFRKVLSGCSLRSKDDRRTCILEIAMIIASVRDDRVGQVVKHGDTISVPIIDSFDPYLTISTRILPHGKFAPLRLRGRYKKNRGWRYPPPEGA